MTHRIGKTSSRRRGAYMATAGALALLMFGSAAARADVTDELLDQLKAKGVLTKAEYAKLKARHEAEVAAHARRQRAWRPRHGPLRHRPRQGHRRAHSRQDSRHQGRRHLRRRRRRQADRRAGLLRRRGSSAATTRARPVISAITGRRSRSPARPPPFTNLRPLRAELRRSRRPRSRPGQYNNSNSIRAGLLPSNLVLSLATNQMGWDIGFTAGAYFGGNNVDPGCAQRQRRRFADRPRHPRHRSSSGFRHDRHARIWHAQNRPRPWPVRRRRHPERLHPARRRHAGRQRGARQHHASAASALGYVYPDWLPQITYSTPTWNGFTAVGRHDDAA